MAISCSILNGSLLSAEASLMAVSRVQGTMMKTTSTVWEIIHINRLKCEPDVAVTACPVKAEGEFRSVSFHALC